MRRAIYATHRARITGSAICVLLAVTGLGFSACDLNFVGKKEVNEDTLREFYYSDAPFVFLEAAGRLLTAVQTGSAPGVALTPNGNRVDGTVGIDSDYSGDYETQVQGNVQFPNANRSFDDGATVRITGVTGARVDGSLTATATTNGGSVAIDGTGQFEGDSGVPVDLDLNLSVAQTTGQIIGSVDIDAGDLSATAFYEDNGIGGTRVRVVGSDFEFTVGY